MDPDDTLIPIPAAADEEFAAWDGSADQAPLKVVSIVDLISGFDEEGGSVDLTVLFGDAGADVNSASSEVVTIGPENLPLTDNSFGVSLPVVLLAPDDYIDSGST